MQSVRGTGAARRHDRCKRRKDGRVALVNGPLCATDAAWRRRTWNIFTRDRVHPASDPTKARPPRAHTKMRGACTRTRAAHTTMRGAYTKLSGADGRRRSAHPSMRRTPRRTRGVGTSVRGPDTQTRGAAPWTIRAKATTAPPFSGPEDGRRRPAPPSSSAVASFSPSGGAWGDPGVRGAKGGVNGGRIPAFASLEHFPGKRVRCCQRKGSTASSDTHIP